MASELDWMAGGRYKGEDPQAFANFNDIQRNWSILRDKLTPGGVNVGAAVVVRITSNCSGGGKYNGMIVRKPTTAACNASNAALPEGMTDDVACLLVNMAEDGAGTHVIGTGSYVTGVLEGFSGGTPVVFTGVSENCTTASAVALSSGECGTANSTAYNRNTDGVGVSLPVITAMCYSDPTLYSYKRTLTFDSCGLLYSISAETRESEITFEACGDTAFGAQAPQWYEYTKSYTDFSTAGTTNDVELLSLPAGGIIHDVQIKHSAAFTGGAITAYTVSVGIAGTLNKYLTAFNTFQAPGNTVFAFGGVRNMENSGSTTSIRAAATSTGANLNAATAGSVTIRVLRSDP